MGMPHRVRLPDARRKLLRAVQRIDGPAFTTEEAAEVWGMPRESAKAILDSLSDVGLMNSTTKTEGMVWWLTELARYDLTCAAQA